MRRLRVPSSPPVWNASEPVKQRISPADSMQCSGSSRWVGDRCKRSQLAPIAAHRTPPMSPSTNSTALAGFPTTPDVSDPSGLIAAYWTDPPGVVLRFVRPARGTAKLSEWLVGPAFELFTQRFPGETQLRIVLDMSQMTGRSATARAVLMQSAARFAPYVGQLRSYRRCTWVPPTSRSSRHRRGAAPRRPARRHRDLGRACVGQARHPRGEAARPLARIPPPARRVSRGA